MSEKFAQFGGTGAQSSPFAPGGSPLFRGGPSGFANNDINNFSHDLSLDTIMSRTHKPKIFGFEKPLESLLEVFHDDLERNAEPYLLTQEEREKLKLKKKIRNKEQYLHDLAHSEDTEDNKKQEKIIKKIQTVEQLLSRFRKNENIDFSKFASVYEDIEEASMDNRLNKQHKNGPDSFYRRETSLPAADQTLESVQDYNSENDPLNLTKNRLTEPFTGNDIHYTQEDGLDTYVKGLTSPYYPNEHNLADSELLMNYPDPAENKFHDAPNTFADLSSNITEQSKSNNQTLEQKLEKLKKKYPNPKTLETSLGKLDWDEILKGTQFDRNVTRLTPYTPDGFGTLSNPAALGPGPAGDGAYPIAGYL